MKWSKSLQILAAVAFSISECSYHQPHIVLIVADDLGWNDVGFHGSNQIPTPNIDALAYNGMILNRFYTLPLCTPSRAALLTGQYPIRTGFQGWPISGGQNRHLPLDVPTLPEKLKELGYTTHLIGKWHLGAAYRNVTPIGRGFDHHFGCWNSGVGYFSHVESVIFDTSIRGLDMHDQLEPAWSTQGEYVTHLFTRKAEAVIRTHNPTNPLFLMVSHVAAHTGENHTKLEVPDIVQNDRRFGYIADEGRKLYAGIVSELDKSVGAIVAALSNEGMLDNTIIMFFSDNGAMTEGFFENRGSNWPLRGLKFSLHEGGVRNIALIYSSQLRYKGVVNNELMHITDVMPTLYAAAGGRVENLKNLDGANQWTVIVNNEKSKRAELLLNIDEVRSSSGLIDDEGRYKLINGSTTYNKTKGEFFGEHGRGTSDPSYNTTAILQSEVNIAFGNNLSISKILQLRNEANLGNCRNSSRESSTCRYNKFCLFDLFKDPCETSNIAEDFPKIVAKLSSKLEEYWKQMQPQKNTFIDSKANPIYFNNSWYTWLEDKPVFYTGSFTLPTELFCSLPFFLLSVFSVVFLVHVFL